MKNTDINHRFIHFILQKQLRDAVKLVKHVKGINKKLIRIIMTRYRNTRIHNASEVFNNNIKLAQFILLRLVFHVKT